MKSDKNFTQNVYEASLRKDWNEYFKKCFPRLSKKKKHAKDKILFKVEDNVPVDLKNDKDFLLNGISVFGINNTAFVLAHGTLDGKIALPIHRKGKTKHFAVSPKKLIQEFEDILPERYKNIYTINCYGGKQNKFVTESGRIVQSLHRDRNTVIGSSAIKNGDKVFALLTKQEKLNPEIVKDIYKNVYNGKSVSKSEKLSNLISTEDLKKIRLKLFNDFNSNKFFGRQKQSKQQTKKKTKSKPVQKTEVKTIQKVEPKTETKPIQKQDIKIESKPKNEPIQKPITQKTTQKTKIQSRQKIQRNETTKKQLNFSKSQKVVVNNNSTGNLKMKTLNYQELYEMNKNSNLPVRDKVMTVQPSTQKVVQPPPKKDLLDINANKKSMAMMTDMLQENMINQRAIQQTTAQIAKNICSSGNRYGKGAISIMSKLI